jgi:hypothetical protein
MISDRQGGGSGGAPRRGVLMQILAMNITKLARNRSGHRDFA